MKKCIIIGAGDFNEKRINKEKDDLLIIADGGYYNYLKLDNYNIDDIDVLVGDFDSLDQKSIKLTPSTKIITLNPIKDDTDIVDAVKYGLKDGFNEFYIYGCLGKRIEHSIANIQVLSFIKENNANGYLLDGSLIIRILKNESLVLDSRYKGYISIFSINDKSMGVTLKNLKYELDNYDLSNKFPLGIDNEFIGHESFIEVKDGELLLIYNMNRGEL